MSAKVFVAHIPALHAGYQQVFEEYGPHCEVLYLLGPDVTALYPHLAKDKRAFATPEPILQAIRSWKLFPKVEIIDLAGLEKLGKQELTVLMPNEDIMRDLAERYFGKNVEFVNTFFRHTGSNSTAEREPNPDETISTDVRDRKLIKKATELASESSDWWRQVGALIVKDGNVLLAGNNHHLPTEYTSYIDGDPRADFKKGLHIELSLAQHAEAGVIAHAARKGIALEATSIYSTTFPCPNCARLIVEAGIKECYYSEGYAMLDGEEILKSAGVKIIRVV